MNAEIGKYIPGRIVLYGILIYAYKQKNVSAEQVVICSINEAIANITGSILFVLVGSIFFKIESVLYSGTVKVIILLLAIALLLPQPQQYLFRLLTKISKNEDLGQSQNHSNRLQFALLFFVNWIIYGISFFFLIKTFFSIDFGKLISIMVIYCVSTLIGFLAFFVPAGLGVREGTLTVFLTQIIPLGAASFISVFSRVWLMMGELVLFFCLLIKRVLNTISAKKISV